MQGLRDTKAKRKSDTQISDAPTNKNLKIHIRINSRAKVGVSQSARH